MDEYTQTLVVNEHDPLSDLTTVTFIVKSVFAGTALESLVPELSNYVCSHAKQLPGHDAVIIFLQKYFVEKMNGSNIWDPLILEGMRLLAVQIQNTIGNRRAYSTDGRVNKNAVFWPNPTRQEHPTDLTEEIPYAQVYNFINRGTAISSAGSCFAFEIAHRLQANGYNYLVTERRASTLKNPLKKYADASAEWGIIFNTGALRQLVEKAFGHRKVPHLLWHIIRDGKKIYRDPFREDVEFDSVEQYEAEYDTHVAACKEALTSCEVFVMTLGLNEVWTLKSDGTTFALCPWGVSAALVEKKVLKVEDNLANLQKMLDVWKIYNTGLKLIITVSPVPLAATFRSDERHVVAANCHSKSVLHVVAEEFVRRNKDVFYFPSYEQVMYCTKDAWDADQRHVSRKAVSGVMKLFGKMFIEGGTFEDTASNPLSTQITGHNDANTSQAQTHCASTTASSEIRPTNSIT